MNLFKTAASSSGWSEPNAVPHMVSRASRAVCRSAADGRSLTRGQQHGLAALGHLQPPHLGNRSLHVSDRKLVSLSLVGEPDGVEQRFLGLLDLAEDRGETLAVMGRLKAPFRCDGPV